MASAGDRRLAEVSIGDTSGRPFEAFRDGLARRDPLRRAVTAATFRSERDCVLPLLDAAALPAAELTSAQALARKLVAALRAKGPREGVEGLIQEYRLSTEEGVALMCLAEALLRIPDAATRDALIRDKIGGADWSAHLGHSPSVFVNAATWGLLVTGKLTTAASEATLGSALMRLVARSGEPIIRAGVDLAMRLLGEQFVAGETIEQAIARSRAHEAKGFRYSYDMLGEAAATAGDAARYLDAYEGAIRAIGRAAAGAGVIERPGISIKLSALHPRYVRPQRARVMAELLPRLVRLAALARRFDIGFNIDAEEADRLELSLDLLEALCFERECHGWDGVGFVVQAYGKRAPYVIDWLIDLARRSRRRLMLRLVKGAYWDSEIKRAQTLGLPDFPVLTRKAHTDVSYLACARKMLSAPEAIYPQFATHNAMTLATVREMAGPDSPVESYEFQCLHGMGEPLYEQVVGPDRLGRPCRIYAPVGDHRTLLAYLVRRLLENGANSSFVNRLADPGVALDDLVADPVATARACGEIGAPHPAIAAPRDLYAPARRNSAGVDLSDEDALERLADALPEAAARGWFAAPALADGARDGPRLAIRNPARRDDVVGYATDATQADVDAAFGFARAAEAGWAGTPPAARAAMLGRAADFLEERAAELYGLLVQEAGKTLSASVSEVREAADFLRYYGAEAAGWNAETTGPLGTVVCISPWNFPLAIFTGQVAAALAAGNCVLAKPAEETPLIAAEAVALLRRAGLPAGALQLLPGDGALGAALVADPRADGVLFTGSTDVARLIQKALAGRLGRDGRPVPLVAETGGQNAMVVDSSALAEQVVADALVSAFDSAGQRCSALRVLCLQEDVADRIQTMLEGAMAELAVGDPERLATDVGPVISGEAKAEIDAHVAEMRGHGRRVVAADLPDACRAGSFVAPTLIEIPHVGALEREVFGPVLHVVRFQRDDLDRLTDEIQSTGYGLTFGLHTRIAETIERVAGRSRAGNVYVNRNIVGAVVGSQPFGGHGLSGTGPKAGGPLYLRRLLSRRPIETGLRGAAPPIAIAWADYLRRTGRPVLADRCRRLADRSPLGAVLELPGPVGERNSYGLLGRGAVLCRARREDDLFVQIGAALAVGAVALVDTEPSVEAELVGLEGSLAAAVVVARLNPSRPIAAALVEDERAAILATLREMADRTGPIVPVYVAPARDRDDADGPLEWLVRERSLSVNTAAAGGDATLLALES
jgi:RHH-type proline utilization regulon transcriptional repressor/proline dehydrogenase/delta 1-pyrroline-5-carboxylate dehydrogenase